MISQYTVLCGITEQRTYDTITWQNATTVLRGHRQNNELATNPKQFVRIIWKIHQSTKQYRRKSSNFLLAHVLLQKSSKVDRIIRLHHVFRAVKHLTSRPLLTIHHPTSPCAPPRANNPATRPRMCLGIRPRAPKYRRGSP